MTGHQTTISSTQRWDEKAGAYVNGYRALCSRCPRWKGRSYPLDQRVLAESQANEHQAYHARVAVLTAPQGGLSVDPGAPVAEAAQKDSEAV